MYKNYFCEIMRPPSSDFRGPGSGVISCVISPPAGVNARQVVLITSPASPEVFSMTLTNSLVKRKIKKVSNGMIGNGSFSFKCNLKLLNYKLQVECN